jgi:AcrR family transcriptional regulator
VEAGLAALARGGPDAVRVEALAAELGVTKGGFYGHFDGEGGAGAETIRRVAQLTSSEDFHRIDIAVRSWARHDPSVAARLRRIDNERMDFLRRMFGRFLTDPAEIEARSILAFALAIGRHYFIADHPGYTTPEAIELAGNHLLRPAAHEE